jgi:hypothetical protein
MHATVACGLRLTATLRRCRLKIQRHAVGADSCDGDIRIGPFKGRVTAVGGTVVL